jgi:acyl-CoA thioester hydrolase
MSNFNFYCPIQVRYSDLDPQWHVNNARILTFLEQARFTYITELGLFKGNNFFDLSLIVADVHVAYLAPIELGQKVRVGVRTGHIGNKSLTFEYQVEEENTNQVLAKAETVMVAYDYHIRASKPVPPEWRQVIGKFEGVTF